MSQFKSNPSAYLKLVAAGHSVLLFERKKPIAILKPVEPEDDEEAFRQKLIVMGIATAPIVQFKDHRDYVRRNPCRLLVSGKNLDS